MAEKEGFYWQRKPVAEKLCRHYVNEYSKDNPAIGRFADELHSRTSTEILHWTDHIIIPEDRVSRERLQSVGFESDNDQRAHLTVFRHPGALFPRIIISGKGASLRKGLAIRVESVADFLQVNGFRADIEGKPYSPLRRAVVSSKGDVGFVAVERHGDWQAEPLDSSPGNIERYISSREKWKSLPRSAGNEDQALDEILKAARELISTLGTGAAAHIVCACERDYWISRNNAAGVQKARQDAMGLGWANHDHHTFRSSRRHFSRLVELFSSLGFLKRERFYAGKEAGWGAQLMENTEAGIVLFLDVDLAPDEVAVDFAGESLAERGELGTVGLWCALHGDSILKAGMHHIAANFLFDRLISDIAAYNVEFMAPFSDFSYLKQAFSRAERWDVDPDRVTKLLNKGSIDDEKADRFLSHGALGSHLENIQRRDGYKGFNRKNVSAIMRRLDPRKREDR